MHFLLVHFYGQCYNVIYIKNTKQSYEMRV